MESSLNNQEAVLFIWVLLGTPKGHVNIRISNSGSKAQDEESCKLEAFVMAQHAYDDLSGLLLRKLI